MVMVIAKGDTRVCCQRLPCTSLLKNADGKREEEDKDEGRPLPSNSSIPPSTLSNSYLRTCWLCWGSRGLDKLYGQWHKLAAGMTIDVRLS